VLSKRWYVRSNEWKFCLEFRMLLLSHEVTHKSLFEPCKAMHWESLGGHNGRLTEGVSHEKFQEIHMINNWIYFLFISNILSFLTVGNGISVVLTFFFHTTLPPEVPPEVWQAGYESFSMKTAYVRWRPTLCAVSGHLPRVTCR
jgi:hypothetical protein